MQFHHDGNIDQPDGLAAPQRALLSLVYFLRKNPRGF
jgi:hypothetical protein